FQVTDLNALADEAREPLGGQGTADAAAALAWDDGEAQQLGLAGGVAEGGVAGRRLRLALGGDQQQGSRMGELAGEHLARPGVAERLLLEPDDGVEILLAGGPDGEGGDRLGHLKPPAMPARRRAAVVGRSPAAGSRSARRGAPGPIPSPAPRRGERRRERAVRARRAAVRRAIPAGQRAPRLRSPRPQRSGHRSGAAARSSGRAPSRPGVTGRRRPRTPARSTRRAGHPRRRPRPPPRLAPRQRGPAGWGERSRARRGPGAGRAPWRARSAGP